jgi:hypothetical protein
MVDTEKAKGIWLLTARFDSTSHHRHIVRFGTQTGENCICYSLQADMHEKGTMAWSAKDLPRSNLMQAASMRPTRWLPCSDLPRCQDRLDLSHSA